MNTNNEKQAVEKISAYIDDALNGDEIESLLGENVSAEQTDKHFSVATRYHMVGDALRGELSDASMVDVSAQIHQALLHESFDAVELARAVKTSQQTESRFDFFAWLESFARPLVGMAVAASVAVLMVVTVVQMESPESGQQLASSPGNLPAAALVANKQPVNDSLSKEQQAAEFDTYLAEHAEFAAQDTLQGRIPYVRAVSYEAE
ncbi:MAG: sigma-E factor negative regulatory protein [Gammaproteobacteria bacterium]|nr:sigma-E factor negative regulatory protein [Gammaproteobacteria bacterium]MCK5262593.1 sigma-E factor negative regulatory protein [Gammaproteobacteria bacterium]